MAQSSGRGATASLHFTGLQVCDISDLIFDPATEPKEGGNGNALHAAPLKVAIHPRTCQVDESIFKCIALFVDFFCA
jgi:hypothetical protein